MGEKTHLPQENSVKNNEEKDNIDENDESEEEEEEEFDDMNPEEFQQINNQLDALSTALDDIEQKNDNIHSQLLLLLESNREIRIQMQNANNKMEVEEQK